MKQDYEDIFGMHIRFARRSEDVEGKKFYAHTTLSWERRIELAEDFAKGGAPAIVPNAFGSWYRSLAALKHAGVRAANVVIPRDQNFLVMPKRTAVVVKQFKRIFLPIYKNGTSSFRALVHAHFLEFAACDPKNSTSLNSTIDPLSKKFADYKSFTFVRQPMERFGSFFRDKILALENHMNIQNYAKPIEILMEGKLTAKTVAEFVSLIPPEYCDPHIKPQWMTITFRDKRMAKHIFRLGDRVAMQKIGIPFELPRKLSTRSRLGTYQDDATLSEAERLVKDYYRRDYRIWREIRVRDMHR